jgi:hypothetical protein
MPSNPLWLLPTICNTYKPFVVTSYHLQCLQTLCGCCLPYVAMLPSLQTSNFMSTSLLLTSSDNYCHVQKIFPIQKLSQNVETYI